MGVSTIRVLDRHLHSRVTKAFEDDGYRALGDGLIGHTVTALVSSAEMHDLTRRLGAIPTTSAVPDAARSAVLEHTLRPLRILDAQLPTYLVSINEGFADELLGYPPSLLPRPTGVALGLEQAYYRAGKAGERAPGRILWRLTGRKGEVFACSSLIGVHDGTPEALHRRFERLGVLSLRQIREQSDKADRRVLHVRETQLFDRPIGLSRLKAMAAGFGQGLQWQSPCLLNPVLAGEILREGFDA